MPFCEICGKFKPHIITFNYCRECYKKFEEGTITDQILRNRQRNIEKTVNFRMMYYPQYLFAGLSSKKNISSQSYQQQNVSIQGNIHNNNTNNSNMNTNPNENIQMFEYTYRQSSSALTNSLIGAVFSFINPMLGFLFLFLGLIVSFVAWKREGRNWRLYISFGLCAIFILINMIMIMNQISQLPTDTSGTFLGF